MDKKKASDAALSALPSSFRLFRNPRRHREQTVVSGEVLTEYPTTSRGKTATVMEILNARRVQVGLDHGSHDYLGWAPVKVTLDMVGQTIGQFVSMSIRAASYREMSDDEKAWARSVLKSGGKVLMVKPDSSQANGIQVVELTREMIQDDTAGTREARHDWDNAAVFGKEKLN